MKNVSLFLFFLLGHWSVCAQVFSGRVLDEKTKEPLAFVAIGEVGSTRGGYSDIDGKFAIEVSGNGAQLRMALVGYDEKTVVFAGQDPQDYFLKSNSYNLSEVVIRPGENPAERIMKKVIAERDANNPEGDRSFNYKSYNKFVFTTDIDSTKLAAKAQQDTSMREMAKFFAESHLMLMESVTERKYSPPGRTVENILANKISGLTSPDFAMLATELQSFSFYTETFKVNDINYLSPLASSAVRKYLFILEDTTFVGLDTVYTISFRPRRHFNFEALKGQLFISTNGYALQQVIAEPNEQEEGINIRIQQNYNRISNKWFPYQLNVDMTLPGASVNGVPMKGEGRSYVSDVNFDLDFSKRDFGPIVLMMEKDAKVKTDAEWDSLRFVPLNEKEKNTYRFIDSLGKEANLDKKVKMLEMALTGKIPIGKISLDLGRILSANAYEGFRLGIGAHTNDFLSPYWSVGGYYGYGFKDKAGKYGADFQVNLYRKRNAWLKVLYENDVREMTAGQLERPFGGLLAQGYYPVFVSRMDRYEKTELLLHGRLIGNVTGQAFLNRQFIQAFSDYGFTYLTADNVSLVKTEYATTEAGFWMRWAPGERLARMGNREIRLGGRWPVLYLKYTQGLKDVLEGEFAYRRVDAMIEKTFKITNVGELSIRSYAGFTEDDLPLSFLYNARGTNSINYAEQKFVGIAAPFTFETMRTNEFAHSEFVAVHVRHQFKELLLKTEKFRPYISIVHNMLWGRLNNASQHSIATKSANKGFFESGLVLDNLMKSGFTGLGLGFFYRYGPEQLPVARDNFAAKVSMYIRF
ncbi:MAG: hypothetical protein RLZZ77_1618 [Bacteroidota bacterium]